MQNDKIGASNLYDFAKTKIIEHVYHISFFYNYDVY